MSTSDQESPPKATPARSRPRRRGRSLGEESQRTCEDILRSARELFGEFGYEQTNLRDIAARAGVTRSAITYYFSGKQALYEAVFESSKQRVVVASAVAAAGRLPAQGRLGAFLRAAVVADSRDRSFARFLASCLLDTVRDPDLADGARHQLDQVRQFVRSTLEDGMAAGEIRPDLDVSATAEMLVAAMWGMGLYAGFIGTHDQLEDVAEQFGHLLEGRLF